MFEILQVCICLLVMWYTPIILYEWFGVFTWWFHDKLKWHKPDKTKKWNKGEYPRSICKVCGQKITRDCHGYWLTDDEW